MGSSEPPEHLLQVLKLVPECLADDDDNIVQVYQAGVKVGHAGLMFEHLPDH
jgi:hypothetical protein